MQITHQLAIRGIDYMHSTVPILESKREVTTESQGILKEASSECSSLQALGKPARLHQTLLERQSRGRGQQAPSGNKEQRLEERDATSSLPCLGRCVPVAPSTRFTSPFAFK